MKRRHSSAILFRHTVIKSLGFSLIELIAVIVIISTLSTFVIVKASLPSTHLQTAYKDVLNTLRKARLIALTSNNSDGIKVVLNSAFVDIQYAETFPSSLSSKMLIKLPQSIQLTKSINEIVFNKWGETLAANITLRDKLQEKIITVSKTGYAY